MQKFPESAVCRYSGAIIAIVLSTAVRLVLDPFLGNPFPVATHFLAVLVVAGYAGRGSALLATGLCTITSAYFIVPPRLTLWVEGIENQSGLLLYLLVGGGIALLGGASRSARQKAEADAHLAVRQREQLRIPWWNGSKKCSTIQRVSEHPPGDRCIRARGRFEVKPFLFLVEDARDSAKPPENTAVPPRRILQLRGQSSARR
jgi:Domain of unknown function (DUF4118)